MSTDTLQLVAKHHNHGTIKNHLRQQKAKDRRHLQHLLPYHGKEEGLLSSFRLFSSKNQWDEQKSQLRKNHQNAQIINAALSQRYYEIQKAVIDLDKEGLFTIDGLKEHLSSTTQIQSFKEYTDSLIKDMFQRNETGNALVYQCAVNSIFKFKPSKALRFTDISIQFLERYQKYLFDEGRKVNTVSNYLRTLRAIYNKAIKAKIVDKRHYPFHDISIRSERTSKRAFSKEVLNNISNMELPVKSPVSKARDFYMLSFYLIGINFTDLAYLTTENIHNGRLDYQRRKTGTCYSIKLLPGATELIDKYKSDKKYLFAILPDTTIEDSLKAKRLIQQWIKTTNKYLKRISEKLELDKALTTYTIRHSWATIAKRLGYSKELIAEALGHQQGNQVTEIYLDSFDREVIDSLNEVITK